MIMATRRELPVDVKAEQVWRERDSEQHWKVFTIDNGLATLQRCTPGGHVLNQRYMKRMLEDDMHAHMVFVGPR